MNKAHIPVNYVLFVLLQVQVGRWGLNQRTIPCLSMSLMYLLVLMARETHFKVGSVKTNLAHQDLVYTKAPTQKVNLCRM